MSSTGRNREEAIADTSTYQVNDQEHAQSGESTINIDGRSKQTTYHSESEPKSDGHGAVDHASVYQAREHDDSKLKNPEACGTASPGSADLSPDPGPSIPVPAPEVRAVSQ